MPIKSPLAVVKLDQIRDLSDLAQNGDFDIIIGEGAILGTTNVTFWVRHGSGVGPKISALEPNLQESSAHALAGFATYIYLGVNTYEAALGKLQQLLPDADVLDAGNSAMYF